jgi:hypothetical protein
MEIKDLLTIYETIISKIESNPESAFEYFTSEWSKLMYEEKEIIKPFLAQYAFRIMREDSNVPVLNSMHMMQIEVDIATEYDSNRSVNKLTLTDNTTHTKDVQIAKLFYDLKVRGHFTNTLEELAAFITNGFNLDYDTIYKYLTHPNDAIKKANPLL